MPDKSGLDTEQHATIDAEGAVVVGLLAKGLAERPFGSLTVTYHWKASILTKREVSEGQDVLLLRKSQP